MIMEISFDGEYLNNLRFADDMIILDDLEENL